VIDWLTLRLPLEAVGAVDQERMRQESAKVYKVDAHGAIEWCVSARQSIRSDSHQTTIHVTAHQVEISGSPARVMGNDNVFGSGDIVMCARAMIRHVNQVMQVSLPELPHLWRVSRVDVTHNYALGAEAEVRQALGYLRHAEGGRLQVRTAADTVYWSPKSKHRSAKAYAKGPHMLHQQKKGQAEFSDEAIALGGRLLRLELSLKSMFWKSSKMPWYEYPESLLDYYHHEFFGRVVGKIEVKDMNALSERCEKIAKTKGQGQAAYRTFALVKAVGEHNARGMMPRSTWMRHRKILFTAGLTFADLNAGNIVPLRQRVIEMSEPVRSWDELRQAA